MSNLLDYYKDLLNWEGQAAQVLVDAWPLVLRTDVENAIALAVSACAINGTSHPVPARITNQAIGNKVENITIDKLASAIQGFSIEPCSGAGYPDKVLTRAAPALKIPLEVKATSDWNPNDSNRRVLTSSSTKLRSKFQSPIYHLLLTTLYTQVGNSVTINAIRLDFLEPSTEVSVRLEASVNHKILARGPHHSVVF